MFSIKGIFKDNKIKLSEPLKIEKRTNVIITFLEDDTFTQDDLSTGDLPESKVLLNEKDHGLEESNNGFPSEEELPGEDCARIRKHKRYRAKGNISFVDRDEELIYPLFDYSAGGLNFISDRLFEVGRSITASIKDPNERGAPGLDFEFEVARVENNGENFKIACKFFDEVNEKVWHSLMS